MSLLCRVSGALRNSPRGIACIISCEACQRRPQVGQATLVLYVLGGRLKRPAFSWTDKPKKKRVVAVDPEGKLHAFVTPPFFKKAWTEEGGYWFRPCRQCGGDDTVCTSRVVDFWNLILDDEARLPCLLPSMACLMSVLLRQPPFADLVPVGRLE